MFTFSPGKFITRYAWRTASRIGNITVAERSLGAIEGRSNDHICHENNTGNVSFSYNRCVVAIGKYSIRFNKPTPHCRKLSHSFENVVIKYTIFVLYTVRCTSLAIRKNSPTRLCLYTQKLFDVWNCINFGGFIYIRAFLELIRHGFCVACRRPTVKRKL